MVDTLASLGYSVSTRLLNAGEFGLAQIRERLFMVCVHDSVLANRIAPFVFPKGTDASKVVADILEAKNSQPACTRPMERLKRDPKARSSRVETVGLIFGKAHHGYRAPPLSGRVSPSAPALAALAGEQASTCSGASRGR